MFFSLWETPISLLHEAFSDWGFFPWTCCIFDIQIQKIPSVPSSEALPVKIVIVLHIFYKKTISLCFFLCGRLPLVSCTKHFPTEVLSLNVLHFWHSNSEDPIRTKFWSFTRQNCYCFTHFL